MGKKSLARQFAFIFIIFALALMTVSSGFSYINETSMYRRECIENLHHITEYLSFAMSTDEPEFDKLKEWYSQHEDEVEVTKEFSSDLKDSRELFYNYMIEKYPGKNYGINMFFDDLDEEGKRLFVNYRFNYWFTTFFDARDTYGLSYVYFIYPEEGQDHVMNYMFDPTLPTRTTADGREVLDLGDKVFEDPAIHPNMWKSWENGTGSEGFDSLDNEFGYVYTYCYPVTIDGKKLGVVCADISVDKVNMNILNAVTRQSIASIVVISIGIICLFIFTNRKIIRRIGKLEKNVDTYSRDKDTSISETIKAQRGQNDEIGDLSDKFSDMIIELDDHMKNLQKVTAEKERIGAELNVATQIQADMLPRIFPPFPTKNEFEMYATMDPAKEVGGDFYDFFLVDKDHLALVIADVSGKGVPAALFMVIAKTLIKNYALMGQDPAQVLSSANEQLCEGNESNLFVTVWMAILDLGTGDGIEANAGHEHPAIRHKDGDFELIKTKHSPAVATMEGMRFRQAPFHLDPGDTLYVYTDGVTEATNSSNELFGEERLLDALNKNKDLLPNELLPAVRKEIDAFVADAPQFDDITMMGFKYNGRKEE